MFLQLSSHRTVIHKVNCPEYDKQPMQLSWILINFFASNSNIMVLGQKSVCFLGKALNLLFKDLFLLSRKHSITISSIGIYLQIISNLRSGKYGAGFIHSLDNMWVFVRARIHIGIIDNCELAQNITIFQRLWRPNFITCKHTLGPYLCIFNIWHIYMTYKIVYDFFKNQM